MHSFRSHPKNADTPRATPFHASLTSGTAQNRVEAGRSDAPGTMNEMWWQVERLSFLSMERSTVKKNDKALHIPVELERVHVGAGEVLLPKWAIFFCWLIYSSTQQTFLQNLLYATHRRIRESMVSKIVKVPTLTKPFFFYRLDKNQPNYCSNINYKLWTVFWRGMQVILHKHITSGLDHISGIRKSSLEEMSFQMIWKGWVGSKELHRQKEKKTQWPQDGKGVHSLWGTEGWPVCREYRK